MFMLMQNNHNTNFLFKGTIAGIVRGFLEILMAIAIIYAISFCLFPHVDALNVTPYSTGSTFIDWKWDTGVSVTNISLDGNIVASNQVYTSNEYIASNLKPSSTHYLEVYTNSDSGYNKTSTQLASIDYVQLLAQFIYQYIWLIVALILLKSAAESKNKLLGMLAGFIALVGIGEGVVTQDFTVYMIYIIVFACGWLMMDV